MESSPSPPRPCNEEKSVDVHIITNNKEILCKLLNFTKRDFNYFVQHGTIEMRELDTDEDKAEKFVEVLGTKDGPAFDKFLKVLEESEDEEHRALCELIKQLVKAKEDVSNCEDEAEAEDEDEVDSFVLIPRLEILTTEGSEGPLSQGMYGFKGICFSLNAPTPSSLFQELRRYPAEEYLTWKSKEGTNILQECVIHKKAHLLKTFFFRGFWSQLYSTRVTKPGSYYDGDGVKEIAEKIKCSTTCEELEKWNKVSKALENHPLHQACLNEDITRFEEVIQENPTSIKKELENLTCLDLAIGIGSENLAKKVIEAEKHVNLKRECLHDQLCLCVDLGLHDMIKYINTDFTLTPSEFTGYPKSHIERAIQLGEENVFKALLEVGADFPETALAHAASYNQKDMVRVLLRDFNDKTKVSTADCRGKTAAHFAAEKGNSEILEILFQVDEVVGLLDKRERSVLHNAALAIDEKPFQVIRAMINDDRKLGALLMKQDNYMGGELCFLVRGRDNEQPAWHYVLVERALLQIFCRKTKGGQVEIAEYGQVLKSGWGQNPPAEDIHLVEDKFDPKITLPDIKKDMTPLHLAILKKNTQVALAMIEIMPDINVKDCFGLTPLHLACMRGDSDIIKALLDKGASWEAEDSRGRTPVEIGRINEQINVLNFRQEGSLNSNTEAFKDYYLTPFMRSITPEEIQRRLRHGIDIKLYMHDKLSELRSGIEDFLTNLRAAPLTDTVEQ